MHAFPLKKQRAMTMLELMLVMAIVSLISALSIPAVSALKTTRLDGSTMEIEGTLKNASNYAVSHRVYVWAGIMQSGNDVIIALASPGMSQSLASSDVRLIQKPVVISGVTLKSQAELTHINAPQGDEISSGNFGRLAVPIAGQTQEFDRLILFSPQGEALIVSQTIPNLISIGVALSNASTANSALLQISGLTSKCEIIRP